MYSIVRRHHSTTCQDWCWQRPPRRSSPHKRTKSIGGIPSTSTPPQATSTPRQWATLYSVNTLWEYTRHGTLCPGGQNKINIILHVHVGMWVAYPQRMHSIKSQSQVTLLPRGRMMCIQWKPPKKLFSELQASVPPGSGRGSYTTPPALPLRDTATPCNHGEIWSHCRQLIIPQRAFKSPIWMLSLSLVWATPTPSPR